jgi:hypothetical protein
MTINIDNAQFYYDLFYQVSFLVVLLIYIWEGINRKFPLSTWILLIVTVRLFFIIGTKLGAISSENFNFIINNFQLPEIHSKNMLGGLILGLIGIGLAKVVLKVKYPILNAFAIAVPVAMAIQRVGCLLAGCCFGNETNFWGGVQYGVGSSAFHHHYITQKVGLFDTLSLTVHPVPVYIIIYCTITAVLIIRFRHLWKRPGNLALSSLALILMGRFVVEFFRSSLSNGDYLGNTFLGIKVVQIVCLAFVIILCTIIYWREKVNKSPVYKKNENHPIYNASYLMILTALLVVTKNWFEYVEFMMLLMVLIPAVIAIVTQLIRHYPSLKVRVSTVSILLLSFLLMGQTTTKKELTQKYKSIKIGFTRGEYESYHNIGQGSGCDRRSGSQDFKQEYNMLGGGYSITKVFEKEIFEYGLNGYLGQQKEFALTAGAEHENMIFGVNPYVNYDLNWLGLGAGLHLGNLFLAPEHWVEDGEPKMPEKGFKQSPVFPQFSARIGPRRFAFIQYKYLSHFPSPFPYYNHKLEIGTGLGLRNGTNLRMGVIFEGDSYFGAYVPIKNKYVIEPYYFWNSGRSANHFSIGLQYRFGHE